MHALPQCLECLCSACVAVRRTAASPQQLYATGWFMPLDLQCTSSTRGATALQCTCQCTATRGATAGPQPHAQACMHALTSAVMLKLPLLGSCVWALALGGACRSGTDRGRFFGPGCTKAREEPFPGRLPGVSQASPKACGRRMGDDGRRRLPPSPGTVRLPSVSACTRPYRERFPTVSLPSHFWT